MNAILNTLRAPGYENDLPDDSAKSERRAFVLRIAPSSVDCLHEALAADELIVGWACADGLLATSLDRQAFREIVHSKCYAGEPDYRRAGNAAGHLWKFVRDMQLGDLVVVPDTAGFYVAEVSGPARYEGIHIPDDSAYRRSVKWLNDKKPIPRKYARAALQLRMKTQGTCADATDLVADILELLSAQKEGKELTFRTDLRLRLIDATLSEIRTGRLENYGFEYLLESLFKALGGTDTTIVGRPVDKGADLVVSFKVAGAFPFTVAIQAKHWQPQPAAGVVPVNQVAKGMEVVQADLGMVVTSGEFSDEARALAQRLFVEEGKRIELIDGNDLASLIVDNGITPAQLRTTKHAID